ncbi:MAG: PepSY domain-containing protein [Gammaproteobacteria bacterium]
MARLAPILRVMLAAWLVLGAASPAQAAPPRQQHAQAQHAAVTLGRAVAEAEARTGGRVLSAEKGQLRGEPVYRIKVLTSHGRVRVLIMDARTGKWLR